MSDLFDLVQVTETYVLLKFSASIKSSTLINENFVLSVADATPSQIVANAFEDIDLVKDYKSISRTLYLWWNVDLAAHTDYLITVSNISNALSGQVYPLETIEFTTQEAVTPDDEERPTREPIDVEDYSIKDPPLLNSGSYSPSSPSSSATPSNVMVEKVIPTIDDAYYLEGPDFDGLISVQFNTDIDSQFVTPEYFILQKKSLVSGLSKWEAVNADVVAEASDDSLIFVYLPSNDEDALYSHSTLEELDYWIPATKYRLTISGQISSPLPDSELGASATYEFLGELHPLYIDPNEVLIYYPDGDIVEITEYVYWASKDLEYILGKTDITDITPVMHDFILSSVLCKLSRIYIFDGGMNGFSTASSFTLGDLSVNNKTGTAAGSSGNGSAGVDTWCDLAAILRAQLNNTGAGMKAIVKGSNFPNPIPDRSIKRFER